MCRLYMIIVVLCGLCVNIYAETYWIDSHKGEWGNGSKLVPFPSIDIALEQAGGGNTFIFKPGNYPNPNIVIGREHSGTKQKPTIIMSQYKYKTLLHGSVIHNIHIKEGCKWVIVDGFEISGAKRAGILIHGSDIIIRNCYVHNNEVEGIGAHRPYNIVIENNLVEYNGRHPQFDHGIYVAGKNYTIRNNIVRFNAGWGIHCYPEMSNSVIESNLVYRNYRGGIILISKPNIGSNKIVNNTVARNGDGIVIGNGHNDIIVNNIVVNNFIWQEKTARTIHGWPDSKLEDFRRKVYDTIVTVDYNLCYPSSDVSGQHGFSGNPSFLGETKGIYFLKDNSIAISRGIREYTTSNDFFNNPHSEGKFVDLGCFPYKYTEQFQEMRGELCYGWPYFGRGTTDFNKMPDLWWLIK